MKLSEIVQSQNDRVGALENDTLDEKLITPQIAKVYEYIQAKVKIKITKASYHLCGQVICNSDQLNTTSMETRYY